MFYFDFYFFIFIYLFIYYYYFLLFFIYYLFFIITTRSCFATGEKTNPFNDSVTAFYVTLQLCIMVCEETN